MFQMTRLGDMGPDERVKKRIVTMAGEGGREADDANVLVIHFNSLRMRED